MPLSVRMGDIISGEVAFSGQAIREFALLAGDHNPLHHDDRMAKASVFGGLIASGTHTAAVMMGFVASHLAERGPSVGLGCTMTFRRAVLAETRCSVIWTVKSLAWKPSLKGHIVDLAGNLQIAGGEVAVTATSSALLFKE